MCVDFHKEDEAEKITRSVHNKRSKRDLGIVAVFFAIYFVARLLHSIFGLPSSVTELNLGFAAILGIIFFGHLLELLGSEFREIRIRSKESHQRLTTIENTVSCRIDQVERNLELLMEHLGCSVFAEENWRHFSDFANSPVILSRNMLRAKQGFPSAQFRLGLHYALGVQVQRDLKQAAHWFRASARQGHAYAQLHLGMAYANGEGVEEDRERAFVWTYLSSVSCKEAEEWRDSFGDLLPAAQRSEIEERCLTRGSQAAELEGWSEVSEHKIRVERNILSDHSQ
jgi:hypothetical protein